MFNKYFQDELVYLRELGREFSQSYPALAPMLADRGADPDVERLLEGVAFLTGRIRQKLDDEIPEAIHSIADLLFPHFVRPLPSTSVVEITPLANVLRERLMVPAGSEFGSVPVDGTACRFQSTSACELVPWSIEDVRMEALPGNRQQLRIEMRVPSGVPLGQVAPNKTRLHFTGSIRAALGLLMWTHEQTEDVVLIESKPTGGIEREISIGRKSIHLVGFEEDEALIPFGKRTFPGFRLLEEYYVLPQKFAFIDVEGVGRAAEFDKSISRFAIAIRFRAPCPEPSSVTRESVKLHCVPIVNVFETTAEPIRLTPMREQFLVRAAGLAPTHGEVYAIANVQTVLRGSTERVTIPPFYDFSHAIHGGGPSQIYYTTHISPRAVGDGADVHISFGTPENAGVLPDADVISLDLWATNRDLAGALRPGEISVPTPSSPTLATFKNLYAATPHVPPPLGRELQWRVVAHAAMGLRSLAEVEVLRSVIDVYNLHALVDRQAARATELRVAAVRDVRLKHSERLFRGSPVRGAQIEIDLDESGFIGDGDMFVFSAVLERLFANYVSLNTFSKTTITHLGSKVQFVWPARSGSLTML